MHMDPAATGTSHAATNVQNSLAAENRGYASAATAAEPFVRSRGPVGVTLQALDTTHGRTLQDVSELALSLDIRNRSPEQVARGGFLTLPPDFGPESVRRMASLPSVLALDERGRAAGFMLMSEPQADSPSPVVRAMVKAFQEGRQESKQPWAVYGPIGVGEAHQGKGLAPMMFQQLAQQAREAGKQTLVGFIDNRNKASMGLHTAKLGFELAGEFLVNDNAYSVIVYPLVSQPAHA